MIYRREWKSSKTSPITPDTPELPKRSRLNSCYVEFQGDEVALVISWTTGARAVGEIRRSTTEEWVLTVSTGLAAIVAAAFTAPLIWWLVA